MTFPIAQRGDVVNTCRGCGCDENHACLIGPAASPAHQQPCCWILLDIDTPTGVCSACAIELEWDMEELALVGRDEGGIPICLKQPRRLFG